MAKQPGRSKKDVALIPPFYPKGALHSLFMNKTHQVIRICGLIPPLLLPYCYKPLPPDSMPVWRFTSGENL